MQDLLNISTHTPHARRDSKQYRFTDIPELFQLTRLMRGVTTDGAQGHANTPISTHTPHARRDGGFPYFDTLVASFQLTRLMRGVTYQKIYPWDSFSISTHTPHARRDMNARTI